MTLCQLLIEFFASQLCSETFFPCRTLRNSPLTKSQNSCSDVSKFLLTTVCLFSVMKSYDVLGSIPADRRWRQDWIRGRRWRHTVLLWFGLFCDLFNNQKNEFFWPFHMWIASRNKPVSLETLDAFRFVNCSIVRYSWQAYTYTLPQQFWCAYSATRLALAT